MSLMPESNTETPNDVPTSTDDAAPIFTETPDAAPPARPPLVPQDEKRARLEAVKAVAAESRRLAEERQRYEGDRQKTAHENALLKQEFEALRANPWGYIRDRHGVSAQTVAEAELMQGSDESRAERAERLAMQTQKQLDDVLSHVRTTQERDQKVAQWEAARTAALSEYESKAGTSYAGLEAWAAHQATRTGTSKGEIVVQEMLDFVDKLKKDPKYSQHVASYTDGEILAAVSQRFDGFSNKAAPKPYSTRTLSDDDSHATKSTQGAPFGSSTWRRQEAREIVAAWKAARGDQDAPAKPYTQDAINAMEAKIIGQDGRMNADADKKHSKMLLHNAKLAAAAKAGAQ